VSTSCPELVKEMPTAGSKSRAMISPVPGTEFWRGSTWSFQWRALAPQCGPEFRKPYNTVPAAMVRAAETGQAEIEGTKTYVVLSHKPHRASNMSPVL
jgi:hypothetical protein